MSNTRFAAAASLWLIALFTLGCGDGGKPSTASGPASIGPPPAVCSLLPADTVGVVYAPNMKAFEDGIKRIVDSVSPGMSKSVDVAGMSAPFLGLDPADVDMSRSVTIAMALPTGAESLVLTTIVPARAAAALSAKVVQKKPHATVEVAGDFVAITLDKGYTRGQGLSPRLSGNFLAGDLSARFDVESLNKTLIPQALTMLEQGMADVARRGAPMPGVPDPFQTLKPMLDGVRTMLAGSTVWDLALSMDGSKLATEAVTRFNESGRDSVLGFFKKTDLATLCAAVPEQGCMSAVMAIDAAKMMVHLPAIMAPSLAVLPPAERASMEEFFVAFGAMGPSFGPGMAMNLDFAPSGMEMVSMTESKDPSAYLAMVKTAYAKFGSGDSAVSAAPPVERTIDGIRVTTWRLKFDTAKLAESRAVAAVPGVDPGVIDALYGKDGLDLSIAETGAGLLMVMGGDERLRQALKDAKSPPSGSETRRGLGKDLVDCGPDTVAFLKVDVRRLMRTMSNLMPKSGADATLGLKNIPDGEPVPIQWIVNAGADRLRWRLSLDIGRIAGLFSAAAPK